MSVSKFTAIILIAGSLLFLIGAFSPVSLAFFSESDETKRLGIILGRRQAWSISQLFFALGAVVTAAGIGLAAHDLRALSSPSLLPYLGAAAIIIAAGLWSWHVYLRAVGPRAFVEGVLPAWHFTGYTLFTQAGLIAIGAAMLRSTTPDWVGWAMIGGALVCFLIYLRLRDLPPFIYYLLTLLAVTVAYRVR